LLAVVNSSQHNHLSLINNRNVSANSFNNNNSSSARTKSASYRPKSKLKYRHNFFDNDYDDYLLAYKNDKEWRKTLNKNLSHIRYKSGESETTPQPIVVENINDDVNNDDDGTVSPTEKSAREKLDKELEQIAKLENESSMAADLLKEIKAEQKLASRKLKIDPWKASRMPSARAEPSFRTRFDSPVNASPSRIFNYGRLSNTLSGHTLSTTATPMQTSTTASTSFFGDTSIASPNQSASNSTIIAASTSNHTLLTPPPPKSATLPANNNQTLSNNIVYNIAVPKPGYGLSSPNKSVTLPNNTRYIGMSTHRSVDFNTRATSPFYKSALYSPSSPRANYEIYPYEQLQISNKKKQAIDVDRQHLERHLSDDEFKRIFGMNLQEFYQLPYWKRVDMKKVARLF
jgi:actin-binding LIM protein